ncbi:MAG TPA: hypothetical protein VN449_01990, partial [Gaiellaceae bacterium]|nr:hypothetical protein [Gaiellaceae bacterium]
LPAPGAAEGAVDEYETRHAARSSHVRGGIVDVTAAQGAANRGRVSWRHVWCLAPDVTILDRALRMVAGALD